MDITGPRKDSLSAEPTADREVEVTERREQYPEVAERLKREGISKSVVFYSHIARAEKRIDLNDIEQLRSAAEGYFAACGAAEQIPTMIGLSAALGWSRKAVYEYIRLHPGTPTGQLLQRLQSVCAAVLESAGLNRQVSEPLAIFLLKNAGLGLTDRAEIEVVPQTQTPYQADDTPEEIARKYLEGMREYDTTGDGCEHGE